VVLYFARNVPISATILHPIFNRYGIHAMTKAPLIRFLQNVLRLGSSQWAFFFVLLPCLVLPASAQVGFPKAAVSVPTDRSLSAALQSVNQCSANHELLVLPPISLRFGVDRNMDTSLEDQAQAIGDLPQGYDLWLHATASGDSLTGKETERQLTERIDSLLDSMPLKSPSVHGLIVEISEPPAAPDLYSFELLRLALTV
jgi:hypothetical protein